MKSKKVKNVTVTITKRVTRCFDCPHMGKDMDGLYCGHSKFKTIEDAAIIWGDEYLNKISDQCPLL